MVPVSAAILEPAPMYAVTCGETVVSEVEPLAERSPIVVPEVFESASGISIASTEMLLETLTTALFAMYA